MKPGIFGDAAPAAKLLSATAFLPRSATLLSLLVLAACAQVPTEPEALAAYNEENDPAEPINRTVFAANQWVDRNALRPVAEVYQEYVPDGVRKRVRNFNANLKEPTVLVNDLLQANVTRAWNTTQRFAVNTTVGGAGLFDVATDWDLPHHNADLGQTFGVWEMGPGPSVQMPLLGPSNMRDTVGTVAGFFVNPLGFVSSNALQTAQMASMGVSVVDQRAGTLSMTDGLEKNSVDYYATLRSMQTQRRAAFVEEGKAGQLAPRVDVGPAAPASPEMLTPDKL